MRMEELSDSQYIKGTDTVERYLLGLVRAYFADSNVAEPASRDFIIRRAVARMKEEFRYENIGVLSITLADGQPRTGPVSITLADLGAEPAITPKLTAFNVNFGDQANTACEGNDPRLSDARTPLPHVHDIQDINGLEGRLSTLLSLINRVNGSTHVHTNSNVLDKLVYTGNNPVINLDLMYTLNQDLEDKMQDIRNRLSTLINTDIPQRIAQVQQLLTDTETNINAALNIATATHNHYLGEAKKYTDDSLPTILATFNGTVSDYVKKTQLTGITTGCLSFVGNMLVSMRNLNNRSPEANIGDYYYSVAIPDEVIDELTSRQSSIQECLIDGYVKKLATNEYIKMPYLYLSETGEYNGILLFGINYVDKEIWFSYKMDAIPNDEGEIPDLPSEVRNTSVEIKFYSKRSVNSL